MRSIKYDKLIRDKIPEIIEKSGKKSVTETLDDLSYKQYLDKKLTEEIEEYLSSDDVQELVDLVEVVYAILRYKSVDIEEFERIRKFKADERGAFSRRLLLKEVISE